MGKFSGLRMLVVGDVMLDEFVWGKVSRISPEAPVPVVEVQREEQFPGGAANVARSLRAMGAGVDLIGRVGRDGAGHTLGRVLADIGVGTAHLVASSSTPTTVKTRVIARSQQVVRVDREKRLALCGPALAAARRAIGDAVPSCDAVIVEDYGKGFVTQELVELLRACCARHGKPWMVDPNPTQILDWSGATVVKPNRSEAFAAMGWPASEDPAAVEAVGRALLDKWEPAMLLVTLGERGMQLFRPGCPSYSSPTKAPEVYDVSGAGDTSIAAFALALCAGADPVEATEIANHAAGVVVGKLGTATVSPEEILGSFRRG